MAIRDLFLRMRWQDKELKQGAKEDAKALGGLNMDAKKLGKALDLLAAGGIAFVGKKAVDAAFDLAKLGAQSMQLEQAFKELATSAGGSADDILAAIKRASGGTVAEMDIMAAANKGILLGLGANAEAWGQITEVARYRARAMGRTVTEALDDITIGIGRESRQVLDNLGIILDMDQVMHDFAATLGTTASALDESQRKQAIMYSVIEEGQKQIEAAGGIALNAADKFLILDASIRDVKVAFGELLAVPVADGLTGLSLGVQAFLGQTRLLAAWVEGDLTWETLGDSVKEYTRIVEEEGLQAQVDYINGILDKIAVQNRDIGIMDDWYTRQKAINRVIEEGTPKVEEQAKAYKKLADETRDWIKERMWASILGQDPYEDPAAALAAIAKQVEDIGTRAEETAKANETAADRTSNAWEDAAREAERAWDDFKGLVESALRPTAPNALDFVGEYVDKWDEAARRLDAIAERGFEEIAAHADWAGILKIPPEILASSGEALMEWARQTSEAFRNLERPDLLDSGSIAAAVEAVRAELERQAAVELSLEIVARAAVEAGVVGPEQARQQVAEALGLTEAVPVGVHLVDTAQRDILKALDAEKVGQDAGEQMLLGVSTTLSKSTAISRFTDHLQAEVENNERRLYNVGVAAWSGVEDGFLAAMANTAFLSNLARLVAPHVASEQWARDMFGGHY